MQQPYSYQKFYRISATGAWEDAIRHHHDSVIQEYREFQILLTAFGFETTRFELDGKDITVWPTENDKKVCRHLMKKQRSGRYLLRHHKPLYREWKHRKMTREAVSTAYPRPENFFAPACGLSCEIACISGTAYMKVTAFAPIETSHFNEIAGSEYYAAFQTLYRNHEQAQVPHIEMVSA